MNITTKITAEEAAPLLVEAINGKNWIGIQDSESEHFLILLVLNKIKTLVMKNVTWFNNESHPTPTFRITYEQSNIDYTKRMDVTVYQGKKKVGKIPGLLHEKITRFGKAYRYQDIEKLQFYKNEE